MTTRISPLLASVLVYTAITVWLGRDVLAHIATGIVNDIGDPLLNAAILAWNARSIPWTDAWFDFPIFYPTRNALTFSEHLLGLWPLSTPLYWLTGSALAAYNLALLATFPLSGVAMFLLVRRLTGSAEAALVAGLVFAFAPYRIPHLSHIQVLAAFWIPVAILALHEYVESRRRQWLVLFSLTWMLQGAANGYYFVFFSLLVALWVIWFVVAKGLWRPLVEIAAAIVAGFLPLAPIFYRYFTVHRANGFERTPVEIQTFSADLASVLCAPDALSFWGWVHTSCKLEGELFPGVTLPIVCIAGGIALWRSVPASPHRDRRVSIVRGVLMLVALVYALVSASVLLVGPWRIEWPLLRVSVSSLSKPLQITTASLLLLVVSGRRFGAAFRGTSLAGFYATAAVVAWLFALGPSPEFLGNRLMENAPYSWLMPLPGIEGLRVPARFWMVSIFCLAVFAGLATAELLRRARGASRTAIITAVVVGVLADGWVSAFRIEDVPNRVPNRAAMRGALGVELPLGDTAGDAQATFDAIAGGWTTVNGYSGYEPAHYWALRAAARQKSPVFFDLVRSYGDVQIIETATSRQYGLPHRADPTEVPAPGPALDVDYITASCQPSLVPAMLDADRTTRWECGPQVEDQGFTIHLARAAAVGAVVHALGRYPSDFPRRLVMETSQDGRTWEPAWNGDVLREVERTGRLDPREMRVVLPFTPRIARQVRLRQVGRASVYWSVTRVEVRGVSSRAR